MREPIGDRLNSDRFLDWCRVESGDQAAHAVGADHLAPFRLGEFAIGRNLGDVAQLGEMRLQGGAVGGFDTLEAAILPLVAHPVGDSGAVEGCGADLASNDPPASTAFMASGRPGFIDVLRGVTSGPVSQPKKWLWI